MAVMKCDMFKYLGIMNRITMKLNSEITWVNACYYLIQIFCLPIHCTKT
jgi:hypothetical protein